MWRASSRSSRHIRVPILASLMFCCNKLKVDKNNNAGAEKPEMSSAWIHYLVKGGEQMGHFSIEVLILLSNK